MNAHVTLITVSKEGTDAAAAASPGVYEEAARQEMKACQTYLAATGKKLQERGITVDSVCLEGVPSRAIVKYAHDNPVDLIALATHGKGEVAWVLGSTAERIISHTSAPVLMLRVLEPHEQSRLREEFFMGA
jgi:nucleotide-binding universal stress UspA family protein